MEIDGWLMIFCLISLVVLLIIVFYKKNMDEESTSETTGPARKPVSSSPYSSRGLRFDSAKPGASGASGSAAAPSGPSQITIHAYVPVKKTRCCPFCDGENNVTAKFCYICGQSME